MATIYYFAGFESGLASAELASTTGAAASADAAAARDGSYGLLLNFTNANSQHTLRKFGSNGKFTSLGINQLVLRFDYRYTASNGSANKIAIVTPASGSPIYLYRNSNGSLSVYDNTTLLASTATGLITSNTWYALELKIVQGNPGSDSVELRVDGSSRCSASGLTIFSGSNIASASLGTNSSAFGTWVYHYDNVVLASDWLSHTYPTVTIIEPTGDSATNTGWTASAGNKWECIDEIPPASADYISAGIGAGDQRYSATHATAASKSISERTLDAVLVLARMREAASTTTLARVGIRSGAANYETTDVDIGDTSTITMGAVHQTDPATGTGWIAAGLDAAEPLVARSTSDASDIRCEALYLMVLTTPPQAVGAPADIQFTGTVSTYVIVMPIAAGVPADIQFEGLSSTFTMQVAAGAPGDIQFTGTVSTYIIVTPIAAGAPAEITWQGFTSTIATVDMVVEVSLSNLSGDTDEECGVVFRLGNATNFLAAYVDGGDNLVHLSAFEGGVEREIATAAWTPADTAEIRVICQQERIRVWVDRVLVIDVEDGWLVYANRAGLFSRSTTVAKYSDFYAQLLTEVA